MMRGILMRCASAAALDAVVAIHASATVSYEGRSDGLWARVICTEADLFALMQVIPPGCDVRICGDDLVLALPEAG